MDSTKAQLIGVEKVPVGAPEIIKIAKDNDGELPSFSWPGCYPIYYIDKGSNVTCPECANSADSDDLSSSIVALDVNYENPCLYCDHCSKRIESAYAEDNVNDTTGTT